MTCILHWYIHQHLFQNMIVCVKCDIKCLKVIITLNKKSLTAKKVSKYINNAFHYYKAQNTVYECSKAATSD